MGDTVDARLADRVILVTGSTGIAASAAERFAVEGARVFVASRTAAHCRQLATRLSELGREADWADGDLAAAGEAERVAATCVQRFGRIDGLFAVAGGSGRRFGDGPIHTVSVGAWEATLRLNLTTQALITAAVARRMLDQPRDDLGQRGSILLMGSVTSTDPAPAYFAAHAYAAARGGTIALMTTMAAYYAPDGIRVNVVAPGLTRTPMSARAQADPAILAYAGRRQPLVGELMDPEEIAHAAVYLLSPEARAVTGQLLKVDGGWSVTTLEPQDDAPA